MGKHKLDQHTDRNDGRLYDGERELTPSAFLEPDPSYRAVPFWAWNCLVDKEQIRSQLAIFKKMGMGGVCLHVRTGLENEYLSDAFMELVQYCVEQGKEQGLKIWLYDEDRWPSGTAGGMVTKEPAYAAKYLVFTPIPYGEYTGKIRFEADEKHGNEAVRSENGILYAMYDILLDESGNLEKAVRIEDPKEAEGTCWYAYLEHGIDSAWMNNHPYVDAMNKEAITRFIQVTHEHYRKWIGEDFGKTVPAIFTDEPQLCAMKTSFSSPFDRQDQFLPWTEEMEPFLRETYGIEIREHLPEVFWNLKDGIYSYARYCYHDAQAELFARNYCGTIGEWCQNNGLIFAGHLMWEPTLFSQTVKLGEAMRCYRAFPVLPGIDMLQEEHEYNTIKQCQSAARQNGAEGMLCELYGATGWNTDFRTYKLLGDWQAACGVTLRVPHLSWMSMKQEAKRDYPASIFFQSPWWQETSVLEDHYARINTALTRGKPLVRVGVIHPIESYFLSYGSDSQTRGRRGQLEEEFAKLTEILLFGLIDFDFISEANLSVRIHEGKEKRFLNGRVGQMRYETVLVPNVLSLRSDTIIWLEEFMEQGGRLLFLGDCPEYVDGRISSRARSVYERAEKVRFEKNRILEALEQVRDIDIRIQEPGNSLMQARLKLPKAGDRVEDLVYQLREEEGCRWLFVAKGKMPRLTEADAQPTLSIQMKGAYQVWLYETLSGTISQLPAKICKGYTRVERKWFLHDSLLLQLVPKDVYEQEEQETKMTDEHRKEVRKVALPDSVSYSLSEENALLLDTAFWSVDGETYEPEEDILRLDNRIRKRVGLPPRKKLVVQPYAGKNGANHAKQTVYLKWFIRSEIILEDTFLAGEWELVRNIRLNGKEIEKQENGFFADPAIRKIPMPAIRRGENILEIEAQIDQRYGIENFILLGEFGVRVNGKEKVLIGKRETLVFGSYTQQGLPFFTGNLTYHIPIETQGGNVKIRVPHYKGALVKVSLDKETSDYIITSPYEVCFSNVKKGNHRIDLTVYGLRQNLFGQVHFTPGIPYYPSPDSFRSEGDLWMEEYQLIPMGIMGKPEVTEWG